MLTDVATIDGGLHLPRCLALKRPTGGQLRPPPYRESKAPQVRCPTASNRLEAGNAGGVESARGRECGDKLAPTTMSEFLKMSLQCLPEGPMSLALRGSTPAVRHSG